MTIVKRLFATLKRLGIYDDTLIIVTGDHGAGRSGFRADPRAGGIAAELIEDTTVDSLIKSCAIPAVLVKKKKSSGPVRYDDRPITLGDFPASIAGEIGLEHEFPGVDFLTGEIDSDRDRLFYFYRGYEENAAGDEVTRDFTPFKVTGHSWLDASWARYEKSQGVPGTVYELGDRIEFARGGNFGEFLPHGFSLPESDMTWTDRKLAGIAVSFAEATGDLQCVINLRRVWGTNQRVEVWANDTDLLADWMYVTGTSTAETREVSIPARLTEDGLLRLEFRMPNANISPREAGLSETDGRRLGIGLSWIEFHPGGQIPSKEFDRP